MIFHSSRLLTEQGIIDGWMHVEEGKIVSISSTAEDKVDVDFGSRIVLPGIFDTHNHGTLGWYPHAGGTGDVLGYTRALASQGVTEVFPTCTAFADWDSVVEAQKTQGAEGARIMGLHAEGPYLNRVGEKGVDTGHPDIDLPLVLAKTEAAGGALKLMAIAPELPGAEDLIHALTGRGVRCAFAHSNASYEEALASYGWGISVITHTANVMSGLHHRNMGGLGAALLDDHVYNELICDGMHVRNEMIDIMFRIKHDVFHKFMMISDNVPLAGFPAGRYMGPFGPTTITEEGFCLSDTGRLSGSTKPVLFGMKNLVQNLHLPLETVSRMASLNPNEVYGFADHKGSLRPGKDADFMVIDDDFHLFSTWREGRAIYEEEKDTDLVNHKTLEALWLKADA
jgi:N-acetylglucosamine-6-phosphate deacetylase